MDKEIKNGMLEKMLYNMQKQIHRIEIASKKPSRNKFEISNTA